MGRWSHDPLRVAKRDCTLSHFHPVFLPSTPKKAVGVGGAMRDYKRTVERIVRAQAGGACSARRPSQHPASLTSGLPRK